MAVQFSYLVQQPDGSVQTHQSEADRPPTWGELQDFVGSRGGQLMPATAAEPPSATEAKPPPAAPAPAPELFGPPEYVPPEVQRMNAPGVERNWAAERQRLAPSPAAPPPPAAEAPALDLRADADLYAPSAPLLGQERAAQVTHVVSPERSFLSQLPSVGGAIAGAEAGAGLGTLGGPIAPVTIPLGAVIGAAAGSGAGETARLGAERLLGWAPAEEGTAGQRVGNAALRGGFLEGATMPLRLGVAAPMVAKVAPVAEAAETVAPVLTQKATSPLGLWWTANAPLGAKHVVKTWDLLGEAGQAKYATGAEHEAMSTLVDALRPAAKSLGEVAKEGLTQTVIGTATGTLMGKPLTGAVLGSAPTAGRLLMSVAQPTARVILSPTGSQVLAGLPRAMDVAAPLMSTALRTGTQLVGGYAWPSAASMMGPPPER